MDIQLIIFDIDGVITEGEAKMLDHDFLSTLAALNKAARETQARPPITLCTGRPAPYLEVMLQAIDGKLPGIFENGAGLYDPSSYRFLPHPELQTNNKMPNIRKRLEEGLVQPGIAYFQPGKDYTLTLFPTDPDQLDKLSDQATRVLGSLVEEVSLVYSTSCLNIIPRGIDKGKGIEYLSKFIGIPPEAMLGVGDSDVDLPFLSLVGYSAAPANAGWNVKRIVQYISPLPTMAGVMDVLNHFDLA